MKKKHRMLTYLVTNSKKTNLSKQNAMMWKTSRMGREAKTKKQQQTERKRERTRFIR